MEFQLPNTLELLERGPRTFAALLRGLPAAWTDTNEGGESWTPKQVVRHLVRVEKFDWMRRLKILLGPEEGRVLAPVAREVEISRRLSLPRLLDDFAKLRKKNVGELRRMRVGKKELEFRGRHTALGDVQVSELLATWMVHDLTHLHQVSRILARQYGTAVGPWEKYLGVLHCDGHSRD